MSSNEDEFSSWFIYIVILILSFAFTWAIAYDWIEPDNFNEWVMLIVICIIWSPAMTALISGLIGLIRSIFK